MVQVPTLIDPYKREVANSGDAGLSGSVGMAAFPSSESNSVYASIPWLCMCKTPSLMTNVFALFRVARFWFTHPFLLDTSRSGDSHRS